MPKMRDMLPWHIMFLRYKNPELMDKGLYHLFPEFKKTNWKSKEALAFHAGWTNACALMNVRVDDLLVQLKVGRHV